MKRFLFIALSSLLIIAALAFHAGVARASGEGNTLFGVAAISEDDVWATGQFIPNSGPVMPLFEHWNGHTWQVVSSPTPAGAQFSQMSGLAAISEDDVWAVGTLLTTAGDDQTFIEHWNGFQWKIVPSPNPAGAANSSLHTVAAVSHSNVWAVGETRNSSGSASTLIEHWNGHSWQIVSSPNASGSTSSFLLGVATVPHDEDVWAVGASFNSAGAFQALIERWNGHMWQIVPSTAPAGGDLSGVAAVSHNDVWAVGDFEVSIGHLRVLIEHWNGHTWQAVPGVNPAGSSSVFLNGVTVVSHNNVWAVGNAFNTTGSCQNLIEHWNGHAWSIVPSANLGGLTCFFFNSVSAVPHDEDAVWAVGNALGANSSTVTLIERWNGHTWRIVPSPTP